MFLQHERAPQLSCYICCPNKFKYHPTTKQSLKMHILLCIEYFLLRITCTFTSSSSILRSQCYTLHISLKVCVRYKHTLQLLCFSAILKLISECFMVFHRHFSIKHIRQILSMIQNKNRTKLMFCWACGCQLAFHSQDNTFLIK